MGEFMQNDHDEGSLLENIGTARTVKTHPLIEKYQQTIQDLRNQLLDSQAKVKAMEQERAVIQKFSQPSKKPSVSSSSSKRHAARIKMRRTVISTSATLRKKHKKTKKRKEDDEDEGIVNDFQEQDVRQEEVKESIAKVRADIRKSLEVLELPLEESSYEEELKVFEAEERDLQQQRQENELFLSSLDDYIRDIETLEVLVWKNEEFKDSTQSQSSDENTVQSRISQQPYVVPSKYTEKLSKMLHQIQSDIKVKEELVSHLEKSETEFAFMRKKFDEKINILQAQLVEMQKEKDMALMRTKSNMAIKADIKQQVEPEIRQEYESKIKQLHAKIQDLTRKYTNATTSVQSARNQNESALKTLKLNIQRLEAEKKRLAQRMRAEAERVREQFSRQERKIQQLQRQQAQYNQAKKRLEREHEEQKNVLRKRNEEIMMSTSQLKQIIAVMKKAVREGGILDEKMLAKLAPVLGGHFAVIARGGGHGFPKKKKKNPIPLTIRISRKKQLLDRALTQYIQGKQAIFEMEQLLLRREKLVKEKLELEEEREHVYEVERDHEENTGQPMDMIAIELMDERIEDISAEISYLTSRRDSITPSPDRFYNMIQKRLSREEEDDETIEQYIFDHESSTSSIRSIHLRRGSNDDEDSIRRPSPIIKNKSVFDRLAQTPTRSSKAKMNNRHSSSSVEELKKGWDIENVHRPQSVTTGRF
ncbi:hypothetical protein RMCBS344292_05006 [Rhizopus microsporus]|nr:hypothetical protein RMCBS344292_05006 [Rhizopus microsporus]